MNRETARKLVRMGLEQIPIDGLERLAARMDRGLPVLLSGAVTAQNGEYG